MLLHEKKKEKKNGTRKHINNKFLILMFFENGINIKQMYIKSNLENIIRTNNAEITGIASNEKIETKISPLVIG